MRKMNWDEYVDIKRWIIQNARQLEISLWKYFFEEGSQSEVLDVLALYQNEDGGFGQALEPDNWNINSTPSTTLFALNILEGIGYFDINHPLHQGIINYLSSGKDMKEYGWMFNIPSNYIQNPESIYYAANKEIVKVELEYLIDTKLRNDVWPLHGLGSEIMRNMRRNLQ